MDLVSRQQARTDGLARYFTDKPCPKGHVTERYTSNGKCIECLKDPTHRREAQRRNRLRNPDRRKEKQDRFRAKNPDYHRTDMGRRREGNWLAAITRLGGKCACCDDDQLEFLQLDHKNGGGTAHRKKLSLGAFYYWAATAPLREVKAILRILCANCHHAISTRGQCPLHRRLKGKGSHRPHIGDTNATRS